MTAHKTIPNFIPLNELAKRLRKTTRSVRRMCKKGLIPGSFQIGNQWFVREDSPVFPEYTPPKKKIMTDAEFYKDLRDGKITL